MRLSFKAFISGQRFPHELKEADSGAAPSSGMGDTSGGEQTHNSVKKYASDALDMDQEEFEAGEQGNAFTLYRMYKYKDWPFCVRPPVQVQVVPKSGSPGMNDVTFLLSLKKPIHFYLPYRKGEVPIRYNGPIEDRTEEMSDQEVDDMRAQFADKSVGGGMPAGGMGAAAPGQAGGMPPMGGMG